MPTIKVIKSPAMSDKESGTRCKSKEEAAKTKEFSLFDCDSSFPRMHAFLRESESEKAERMNPSPKRMLRDTESDRDGTGYSPDS